ncbi:MAG: efflux RND transporter periplasmic adaptor subunit [Planctomycetota bacterium]|nr:efflux RND transporter periplasmic adaptor subunit [Planctomycetota bacterium]
MSQLLPLNQDADSPAEPREFVYGDLYDSKELAPGPSGIIESRWMRWTAAGMLLALLAGFMLFSHKTAEPLGSLNPVTTGLQNGTELLVRAYQIPDPSLTLSGQRSFSGTLQARYQSLLGFRVAGKIVERFVEVGQHVKKGQILFRLDPTDFDLQLQVAQADLAAARSQLVQIEAEEQRLADLIKTRSTSQSDHDLAVAARDTARSRLQAASNRETLAKNQRQYSELTTDQDGLVTQLMAEVGQVITPGQSVLQWVHGNELEAAVSIPESMQPSVQNNKAFVEFWSIPGIKVACTLREISPIADPSSRTYDARFTLVDPPVDLAIGMSANVVIDRQEDQGFLVPMGAIAQSQSTPIVWKIGEQGQVQAVSVKILKYGNQCASVLGALRPGDLIVSAGVQRIDSQCRVRVWQDNP